MTMRYLMKGGYWKNSEDEILKAAVMKYGLNQWSRISSLLARKSAKQCKARWYEWLDPSIKKTEWTREEEEKLLHLAKIFPSQWRTIAPIVGRTPAQCVEHYERLLDLAQGRDEMDENDPRKLKPGEIDPTPEIRPARADAKDMDDDEKEMIAETRVRLANIKGKKAKRRAREKFIEKTRQLAQLQKQRELKAAGIEYVIEKKKKKKKVEIDYNAEIPFEHRPADVVFETGMDEEPAPNPNVGNISLNTIEGPRRDEEEKKLRKLDQKKLKKIRAMNLPEHIEKLNKANPLMYQKKTKLVLTDPQLTDKDLELLGNMTKNAAEITTATTSDTTRELMGNYSVREPTPVKTPRYSSQLMREARLTNHLLNPQSPALGIDPLLAEDLAADADKKPRATPNPYKQIISEGTSVSRGETPLSVSAKSARADRKSLHAYYQDELHINNDEWADNAWEDGSQAQFGDGSEVNRFQRIRDLIKRSLDSLPEPRNDYEIDLPELEEFVRREKELGSTKGRKLDLEDIEELKERARQEEKLRDFYKQTQVKQRGLPVPSQIKDENIKLLGEGLGASSSSKLDPAGLIRKEMTQLMVNDMVEQPGRRQKAGNLVPLYDRNHADEFDVDDLEKAEYLLNEERAKVLAEHGLTDELLEEKVGIELDKRGILPSALDKDEQLPELLKVKQTLEAYVAKLEAEIDEVMKAKTDQVLEASIKVLAQDLETQQIELEVYENLKEQEEAAMLTRLHEADVFIQKLKDKEDALQRLYRHYKTEKAEMDEERPAKAN
jgi:pre-mRNA-splicing factor CDC5/CEF1